MTRQCLSRFYGQRKLTVRQPAGFFVILRWWISLPHFFRALGLPTTELSFDDCHRICKAVYYNLPMACHINEYGKLTKYL